MESVTMKTKQYKGFVVVAPPHLNPKQEPDRYAFSGVAVPSGESFACSFRVILVPGYTQPEEFAADVAAQKPLPGNMELFEPDWRLGSFRYVSPTGTTTSARASDAMELTREQLREPRKSPAPTETTPPAPPPEPDPEPDRGMDRDF